MLTTLLQVLSIAKHGKAKVLLIKSPRLRHNEAPSVATQSFAMSRLSWLFERQRK
jgi:hypothetical protein